jgi:hypothetical protein
MEDEEFEEAVEEFLRLFKINKETIDKHLEAMGICKYILINGKIQKASYDEFNEWNSNFENRVIDRTDITNEPNYSDGRFISTVFLGIDHNFSAKISGSDEPAILFETMVFGGKYDNCGWRYSTYGQAKIGHWKIVDCIREGRKPEVEFGERPFFETFLEMIDDDFDEELD